MIVANQTLGGDELVQAVRERMDAGPSDFWVVVPATPVKDLAPTIVAMPVMGGVPMLPGSPEEGRKAAQAKLEDALKRLRAAGATVDGAVGDADPITAVGGALKDRQVDEVIVFTLPSHLSRWLHQDLPHRLEHKYHVPVRHVEVAE